MSNETDSFDKDEQITRMQSTTIFIPRPRSPMWVQDVKEAVAECHNTFNQLQGEFGLVQKSFGKQHQKIEQTFLSKQRECTISHAGLTSRIDRIEDEEDVLRGDLLSVKNDVNSECVTSESQNEFTYRLIALFERFQLSLQDDVGHNQSDTFGLAVLSDELWRAEATSGIALHLGRRLWATLKLIWETVIHKIGPRHRFSLANLKSLLGSIRLGMSSSLHHVLESHWVPQATISFLHLTTGLPFYPYPHTHTLVASFSTTVATTGLLASTHAQLLREQIQAWLVRFCDALRSLKGTLPARPLPFISIAILLLGLFSLIPSFSRRERLDPHVTRKRIHQIQKNLRYHLDSDL